MQLCDLGQGFHLVPVRDHDRITTAKWRVLWLDRQTSKRWTEHYDSKADAQRATRGDRGGLAAWAAELEDCYSYRILPPRKRARCEPNSRAYLLCDPTALQATMILRDVLTELRAN